MVHIGNDWDERLAEEFKKDYYLKLREALKEEYHQYEVYPPMHDIFNAFKYTPFASVKAVILGQDPYHRSGQAHGLSFSVCKGTTVPPSLRNIFTELQNDIEFTPPGHGCLIEWAEDGVMLLNATLTVRAGQANTHRNIGWSTFTDQVIAQLNEHEQPIVFLLWGAFAKAKAQLITNRNHLILTAAHPSPFSANSGYFGCRHFSQVNAFLQTTAREVHWQLTP